MYLSRHASVSESLFVADYENARIQRFQDDGIFVAEWPTQSVDGTAVFPRAIAVDADGNVFVVAQALDRLQKYTSDGDLLVTFGGTGSSDGEFHWPSGIAIGPDGHVYVADSNNARIQEFSSSGVHLRTLGPLSTPPAMLGLVGGVAVDALGNIFSSDLNGDRIVKLSPAGATLLQWGMQGSADGSFDSPGDLSIDPAGNVYVVEQVFPPLKTIQPPGPEVHQRRRVPVSLGRAGHRRGAVRGSTWNHGRFRRLRVRRRHPEQPDPEIRTRRNRGGRARGLRRHVTGSRRGDSMARQIDCRRVLRGVARPNPRDMVREPRRDRRSPR